MLLYGYWIQEGIIQDILVLPILFYSNFFSRYGMRMEVVQLMKLILKIKYYLE